MAEYAARWTEFEENLKKVEAKEKPIQLDDGTAMYLDRSIRFKRIN